MALAKYAEDNLEIYYDRMAMRELPFTQEDKPQQSAVRPVPTQIRQRNETLGNTICVASQKMRGEKR